jgi:GntR family transcriptional regulator
MSVGSSEPRYLKIADTLRRHIDSLGPLSLLPTEQVLCRRFAASRGTVRRALGLLERSGLISRARGRGTSVSPPKVTRRLFPIYTFEQDLREQGIKFETQVVEYQRATDPPVFVAERLQLPRRASVGFLCLARLVDDRVICNDRRYFPRALARRFDPALVTNRAVSELLVELTGKPIGTVELECEIVPCSREVARVLGITPGTLVAANAFTYSLEDRVPIETGVLSYRIDLCKFRFSGRFGEPVVWVTSQR